MEWLGIEVPKWLYNDLKHSKDILEASVTTATKIAAEIISYAAEKNISVGFNIESISIKKEEINAAHVLLQNVIQLVKPAVAAHPLEAVLHNGAVAKTPEGV
jgi:hypothetical protein